MVAVPAGPWRLYALPACFLVAVTLAVVGIRATLHHSPTAAAPPKTHVARVAAPTVRYYRVRSGDTLTAIAVKSGVPVVRLLHLNPKLQPTALFIGERIRIK